jgi:hypothetical protein
LRILTLVFARAARSKVIEVFLDTVYNRMPRESRHEFVVPRSVFDDIGDVGHFVPGVYWKLFLRTRVHAAFIESFGDWGKAGILLEGICYAEGEPGDQRILGIVLPWPKLDAEDWEEIRECCSETSDQCRVLRPRVSLFVGAARLFVSPAVTIQLLTGLDRIAF